LTYQEAGHTEAFIERLFAAARDLGCAEQWRLAVCDVASALILWWLRDEAEDEE
jgi:hypothetical protein